MEVDMGNTYETDGVNDRDEIMLTLQAAIVTRALGNLIGCHPGCRRVWRSLKCESAWTN